MYTVKTISLLALAGSAVAAPQWGNWGQGFWKGENKPSATQTDVAVVTAYTTVTYGGNWGKPTAPAAPATPSPTQPAQQTWAPKPETPAPSPAAPSPAPEASSAPSTGGSSGGYMDVVSSWRSKLGLSALSEDSKLQGNALKTVQDSAGQMVHELNPGSFAQVLAPGSADDFEHVFVGGWLCERPDLSGLNGICGTQSQGWSYGGETGHADILVSPSYSKIGCALSDGIWACDLA